jgi:Rne/Rng family ribonuclease
MKKEMLINVSQMEECRIALLEDGVLEELYTERTSQNNWVGNIYKGKIVNIEPSIQAAFIDFGVGRNGFLHIATSKLNTSDKRDTTQMKSWTGAIPVSMIAMMMRQMTETKKTRTRKKKMSPTNQSGAQDAETTGKAVANEATN